MFTLHPQFRTSEEKYNELPRFLPYGSPFRIQRDDVQNMSKHEGQPSAEGDKWFNAILVF
jgi:hypothetical protein